MAKLTECQKVLEKRYGNDSFTLSFIQKENPIFVL